MDKNKVNSWFLIHNLSTFSHFCLLVVGVFLSLAASQTERYFPSDNPYWNDRLFLMKLA